MDCERNDDCPEGYWCDRTNWKCRPIDCIPNCTGKCCGSDGCDGVCPDYCPVDEICDPVTCQCEYALQCETNQDCPRGYWCDRTVWECRPIDCIPNCTGKCCGTDGCDGTCPNNCPAGYYCHLGSCECRPEVCRNDSDCMYYQCCIQGICTNMSCGALECGNDPVCGKVCGTCGAGEHCDNGFCVQDVTCTWDTDCLYPWTQCCITGVCVYMACGDLECGPDPACGKECGPCPVNQYCLNGRCVPGGDGSLGDPCPWGNVNTGYEECQAGLACLGNDDTGSCPGGTPDECITGEIVDSFNPDCVNGVCGISFCAAECDAQGNCPAGFWPADVSGMCFCIPD